MPSNELLPFSWDKHDRSCCDEHKYFPSVLFLGPNESYDHWLAVQNAVASWQEQNSARITLLANDNMYANTRAVELSQLMNESRHLARYIEKNFPRGRHEAHGQTMRLPPTFGPRQLQKMSEYLYTNDYAVTEDDVRSVQVHGPTCKTCLNYLRVLNFHLDVFQAAQDVEMPGLQLVAMESFLRVMESASETVLRNIVREVYKRRWPTDEWNRKSYQLHHPAMGLLSHDYRADMVVPTCGQFLVKLQTRRDMIVSAGRVPPPVADEVKLRMDLLRQTLPTFDWHMQYFEYKYLI